MTETSKLTRHSIRLDKQTFCKQNGRCTGLTIGDYTLVILKASSQGQKGVST